MRTSSCDEGECILLCEKQNPRDYSIFSIARMSIRNGSDPFDGHDCPVFKKLGSMIQWHPHIPKDKFPIWLKDYNVVHFMGTEPTAHSHSVHILFHEQFQDAVDGSMILPCLRIGHTISLFTPDNGLAVSAITYVRLPQYVWRNSFRSCPEKLF